MSTQGIDLLTDLDCNNFSIDNINVIDPIPGTILGEGDPRLKDQRTMVAGSITDKSVNAKAQIDQFKINYTSQIPATFIGAHAAQAAQGNIVELLIHRDVINGYPSLDVNGDVALAELPFTGPHTGTVMSVGFDGQPPLNIPSTLGGGAGFWQLSPNNSYMGVNGPVPGYNNVYRPNYYITTVPLSLIPSLDTSTFTTGTFVVDRLPVVVGLGIGHSKGIVTDPGDTSTPEDVTDYFARDGTWKTIKKTNSIQPYAPQPEIVFLGFYFGRAYVQVSSNLNGSNLFYRILPAVSNVYFEAPSNPVTFLLDPGKIVNAYVSKAGYNDSSIRQFTVPTPPA